MQGRIIKGIAGFYYVHVPGEGILECKAKGIFRKNKQKPLVGDRVEVTLLDAKDREGNIDDILDRKNELIRPAVANIDQALVIFAVKEPEPNFNLLDRFLLLIKQKELPCVLVFNKKELAEEEEIEAIRKTYEKSGHRVIFTSAARKEGLEELRSVLMNKTSTVAGPSGVGKSSLINLLQPEIYMETGAISEKISRGKHTTRHSQLIGLDENSYICDTPGFSSLSVFDMEKEELESYYPEFEGYRQDCRFLGCSHTHEPDCRVKQAVEESQISTVRYRNYLQLYRELGEKKKY